MDKKKSQISTCVKIHWESESKRKFSCDAFNKKNFPLPNVFFIIHFFLKHAVVLSATSYKNSLLTTRAREKKVSQK